MHTLGTDNGIKRFKCLRGKQDGGTKSTNVYWEMQENVKLWLIEPVDCPSGSTEKEMFDFMVQKGLKPIKKNKVSMPIWA
jgi:hypothetical protein